jgi:hypothetical protein
VKLQYRAPGTTTWLYKARVTSATTGTPGAFAYTWKPPRTYEYRYVFVAANGWGASISPTRRNVVVPLITATLSPTSVALGGSASIKGSVAPNHAGKRVYLRQLVGRTWRDIGSRALSTSSTYAFTVRPTARGYAYYRVAFLGDADHGATTTTNRVLRVT